MSRKKRTRDEPKAYDPVHQPPWDPSEIDRPCNILIIGDEESTQKAVSHVLLTLQKRLQLDGAIAFTKNTDPLLFNNILPEGVIYTGSSHFDELQHIYRMQKVTQDVASARDQNSANQDQQRIIYLKDGKYVPRIAIVYDNILLETSDFKNQELKEVLLNGRHRNLMNIVCVPSACCLSTLARTQFQCCIMAKTNNVVDLKAAHAKMFGIVDDVKDFIEIAQNLAHSQYLVTGQVAAVKTRSLLGVYEPPDLAPRAMTEGYVMNYGKWNLSTAVQSPTTPLNATEGMSVGEAKELSQELFGDDRGVAVPAPVPAKEAPLFHIEPKLVFALRNAHMTYA